LCAFVLPGILLAALPASAFAKDRAVATVQQIKVYPDHYTAGGRRFADLAALESWVKSTGSRSLELHSCMWTATDRLVAAIERFPNVYLDVRWITPGTLGCPSVSMEKAARAY
jgi:hypothetical protein